MILIYNSGGLLLGLGGVGLAVAVAALTRSLTLGVILAGLLWTIFGWRRRTAPDEPRAVSPSVFFIPLRAYGILILLLSAPLFLVERMARNMANDPRYVLLRADLASLGTAQHAGNVQLSRLVQEAINDIAIEELKAENYRVFSRVSGNKALVIVEAEDLKRFSETARSELLDLIEAVVELSQPTVDTCYIGVKGRISYGAMRTPEKGTETGSIILQSGLLSFYGPAAPSTARADSQPATLQF